MEFDYEYCSKYGSYWALNFTEYNGIHFEKSTNSDWIGRVEGDEFSGFSIRCVMDEK